MTVSVEERLELPPRLMTSEPGSFARKTIVERKPQIIRQVLEDNGYPPAIVGRLERFRGEIASQPMQPLSEPAPDLLFWNREWATFEGRTWLEVPWYWAEAFFYRRLLEAASYFQPGAWQGHDPFGDQKRGQIQVAVARLAAELEAVVQARPEVAFQALLHSCLWGNRADLSNESIRLAVQGGLAARQERHNILIDHSEETYRWIAGGLGRVDFICDNAGLDLLYDLALADLLLGQGWVRQVCFHLKAQPFFVSDAMPQDLQATLTRLQTCSYARARELAERLLDCQEAGRLVLYADPFWTTYLMFHQFPAALRTDLSRSGLVILKGDVNYRRLLDDRHWPHTTTLEEVAAFFPAPFLVLRTLKGEIQVGLAPGQAEALSAEDPSWLINGQRGLVHLCLADWHADGGGELHWQAPL
jgi:hypothetical protein